MKAPHKKKKRNGNAKKMNCGEKRIMVENDYYIDIYHEREFK